jgi:hypothetical protein
MYFGYHSTLFWGPWPFLGIDTVIINIIMIFVISYSNHMTHVSVFSYSNHKYHHDICDYCMKTQKMYSIS